MFDNRGSQLRYRQFMPFEEDNFEITPANLHDYLNMCRPRKRKGNYQPEHKSLNHQTRATVEESGSAQKGHQINDLPDPNRTDQYHSINLKKDRIHAATYFSHKYDNKPILKNLPHSSMGHEKIKPNSTIHAKRS